MRLFHLRSAYRPPCAGDGMNESQQILAKSVTERELSQWCVDLAHTLGWRVARWPTFRATATDPGVPDLLLARDGMLLAVELKTDAGRLSEHQEAWIAAAGVYATVWRTA